MEKILSLSLSKGVRDINSGFGTRNIKVNYEFAKSASLIRIVSVVYRQLNLDLREKLAYFVCLFVGHFLLESLPKLLTHPQGKIFEPKMRLLLIQQPSEKLCQGCFSTVVSSHDQCRRVIEVNINVL